MNEINSLEVDRTQYEVSTQAPTTTTTTVRYDIPEVPSEENEIDNGRYDTEEDLLSRIPSSTTTPSPPPPPQVDISEEIVRRPVHVEIVETADSSENRIYHGRSDEIEEEEEIRRVDQDLTTVTQPALPVAPPSEEIEEDRRTDVESPTKVECFEGYALSADGTECLGKFRATRVMQKRLKPHQF